MAEDELTFKPLIKLDCRGCTPSSFVPLSNFSCNNVDSNRKFADVDLSEEDWADYDESNNQTVGVYDFNSRFETYKK